MQKTIPIGVEFYKEMINKDYYYIDKTLLVKSILDSGAKVSLFTRPRRFGKTLAINTIKTFFEDERDDAGEHIDNSRYFAGMKILTCGEKYTSKMGRYPVINLSLKSAKQPNYEMAYYILVGNIREEFRRHWYVHESGVLFADENQKFQDIMEGKAESGDYATSLAFLSHCLKKFHGENTIILIDEYDVPLENAYFEGFYEEMITFIRSLFESVLKTNTSLEFAMITGCLRISKESIFTGLNNLRVISILNKNYAEYFGFTQEETLQMLKDYDLEDCMEEAGRWYDGYCFGDTEVYNPWSILNYVDSKQTDKGAFPKPYWSNTSSNSIIRELIEDAGMETRQEIEELVNGGTIEKPVHEDITYGDIHESQDNLWNFLFFTGYLKKIEERWDVDTIFLRMAIPNAEIRYIYNNTILTWFDKKVKGMDRTPLYRALIGGDCPAIEKTLKTQLVESISFYDAAEQFYHGFMVGMLSGLGTYRLHSNREAGDGRADVIMEPLDVDDPVLVFEFKKADKLTLLEDKCAEALQQIEEKQYDREYREMGYKNYIRYGISFCRKTCMVRAEKG